MKVPSSRCSDSTIYYVYHQYVYAEGGTTMKTHVIKSLTMAALMMALPFAISAASTTPTFHNNKELVTYFWNEVFNKHNTSVIEELTVPNYIQHNPGFKDGRHAFKNGIEGYLKEFPQSTAKIKHIASDEDLVFIHNHIKIDANDRDQAAVDIFRVKNGKIVEHWDVIQDIPETAENNNTMF